MAEEKKNIPFAYIGNALRSAASDGVTTFADEVFDTERQEYQNNVNNYLENKIDDETNRAKAAEEANATSIIGTDRIAENSINDSKLNTEIRNTVKRAVTSNEDASEDDLKICDEKGFFIANLSDGHIETKNFNSKDFDAQKTVTSNEDASEDDLKICDEKGFFIANLSDGHIETKNFNSKDFDAQRNKIISILGDSISTFGTPDQNNSEGLWTYKGNRCRYPQNNLLTDVDKMYWKMLIDKKHLILGVNESWAGSMVSNNQETDTGDMGPNRCISSVTRIKHLGERGTPDYIIVYAGTNDAGRNVEIGVLDKSNPINYTEEEINNLEVSTFAAAYRAMILRLIYYYPLARILVLMPNFTTSYYDIEKLDNYIETIRDICDFFGIKYIDLRTCGINIYNKNNFLPDGIHPNEEGMKLIYQELVKYFI